MLSTSSRRWSFGPENKEDFLYMLRLLERLGEEVDTGCVGEGEA